MRKKQNGCLGRSPVKNTPCFRLALLVSEILTQPDNEKYKLIMIRMINLWACRQPEPIMKLRNAGLDENKKKVFTEVRLVFFCSLTNNGRDSLISLVSQNDAWSVLCVG